jgi:hypothetical protein
MLKPVHTVALGCLGALALLCASPANAIRVAIDEVDGVTSSVTLEGYCDLGGEQCLETFRLPYAVSFGGDFTNQVLIRGDGILQFVGAPLQPTPPAEDLVQFTVLQEIVGNLKEDTTFDQADGSEQFLQSGSLAKSGPVVTATWYTCNTPTDCFTDVHRMIFQPITGGLQFNFPDDPGRAPLFVAATVKASIPEPSMWLLMIGGFMSVGLALRAARTTRKVAAQAA